MKIVAKCLVVLTLTGLANHAIADHSWYTRGFGGISYLNETSDQPNSDLDESHGVQYKIDKGDIRGFALGMNLGMIKAEAEVTRGKNNLELTVAPAKAGSYVDLEGHAEVDHLMGNVIAELFPNAFLKPYIGVGAGGYFQSLKLSGEGQEADQITPPTIDISKVSTGLATQEFAGLRMSIAELVGIGVEGRLTHDLGEANTHMSFIGSLGINF